MLIALLLAGAQISSDVYPSDIINKTEEVGYWSDSAAWRIYEYRTDNGGFCTVYSRPVRTPLGSYELALTFGSMNELALVTSAPVAGGTDGAVDFDDGGGFDWHDIVAHKLAKPNEDQLTYWYGNTMSSGMVQKLIAEMKHDKSAIFTFGGTQFPFSLAGFSIAYQDMKHCENHRLGRVLEE